ncbi:MAG: Serine/threonine protein kinase PrkC, regulator of stationary phase [uncultured Thermomicrobiales bacterium]|uniref:non-specific serine/threonine protein kinase n=1 Tax=uncultured Thermomicrobiales bacterium TaxID=1645740 RepID=A0A6J4V758_9BACT|nr:MAG: Serine/threonine protein kinase PrkC, regulator of stationary phase [uncultured Thermomicrobiales bacterium]
MERTVVNRRYRIDRLIGEGGMARVYRGFDLLLSRDVAVKVLAPPYSRDLGIRTRFEREAQAAASFSHPNIIDIFDVGEEGDVPYIVMEFVDGETLKQIILDEAPFNPDDVAALVEQVASALDYAHERGVVHRDIKPQNIMVDPDGTAKVVDFGIAQSISDGQLTEIGTALGTVQYISPEQANGLMATPASDIYSLGVVAFEMLTGMLPFTAPTPIGVALHHIETPPPRPSAARPYLKTTIDRAVLRALDKNPVRRYTTAGAFAHDLSRWAEAAASPVAVGGLLPPKEGPTAATVVAFPAQGSPARAPSTDLSRSMGDARGEQPGRIRIGETGGKTAVAAVGTGIGCGTWFAGAATLVVLIALVVVGAALSEGRLGLGRSPDAVPTATVATASQTPVAVATSVPVTATVSVTGTVPVPGVVGMDIDAAIDALTSRGFLVDVGQAVYDPVMQVDLVAEQDPPAETLWEQGRAVMIRPSLGSPEVDLAALELIGRSEAEAREILTGQGINVAVESVTDPEIEVGAVVGSNPETKASIGDVVTLYVSMGDLVVVPPDVVGRPGDDVRAQFEAAGLTVDDDRIVDAGALEDLGVEPGDVTVDDGDVVAVEADGEPLPLGEAVQAGSSVTLVILDTDGQD